MEFNTENVLKNLIELNIKDFNDEMYQIAKNNIELFEKLSKIGFNINGMIRKAAYNGDLNLIQNFNDSYFNPMEEDEDGLNMLCHAISGEKNINLIKYLIKKYKNNGIITSGVIYETSNSGSVEIMKLLVQNGADIHVGNDHAYNLSVENEHDDMRNYLKEFGCPRY